MEIHVGYVASVVGCLLVLIWLLWSVYCLRIGEVLELNRRIDKLTEDLDQYKLLNQRLLERQNNEPTN